jgi:hypothetical protein
VSESLVRGFYENLFESRHSFGAWIHSGYEETSAYDPAVSFIEFSFISGVFESFLVAVQDLDVELVGCSKVVQDSGYYGFVVVFADSEAVFSVAQVSINPAKVGGVERIDGDGFLDEIEFVATNDVRFRARALVSCGPIGVAILFDFFKELVGPKVFQFDLDVFGVFVQIIDLSLHLDGGNGRFGPVDDQVDRDLEERVD